MIVQQFAGAATVDGLGEDPGGPSFTSGQAHRLVVVLQGAIREAAYLESDIADGIRESGQSPEQFEFQSTIVPNQDITEVLVVAKRQVEVSLPASEVAEDLKDLFGNEPASVTGDIEDVREPDCS